MDKFLEKYETADPAWVIEEDASPDKMNLYEALFAAANGYLGMRGINEDLPEGSRPGTYLAGIFDKAECVAIEWVNLPNPVSFYLLLDGKKVDLRSAGVAEHRRKLDLRNGAVFRETVYKTDGGRLTRLRSIRFVCRKVLNSAVLKVEVTPLNHSGEISVVTELDGGVTNAFGSYFPDERIKHFSLESINDNFEPETLMKVKTRDRGIAVAYATLLEPGTEKFRRLKKVIGEKLREEIRYQAREKEPVEFTKYISVADARDCPEKELVEKAKRILARTRSKGFGALWGEQKSSWQKRWEQAGVTVETEGDAGPLNAQIRFNFYHLLMNGSETRCDHGIGIKGFTGEMYRGHYFWDTEMYMFPFYLYTNPQIARNLLVFRHTTLNKAAANARERGFKGILFPWESDDEGNEGINPDIDRATGHKRRRETLDQLHINLDVIYAMFGYYRATEDLDYMITYGSDILIGNFRFWESKLEYNKKLDRYETINIMGPDEYHANVNNNYYTNYLLRFCLRESLKFLEELKQKEGGIYDDLVKRHRVDPEEVERWKGLSEKIYLPETRDGVLEQFSGYFKLKDYQIRRYNEFGIPIIEELEPLKDPSHPDYTPTLTHYHEALVKFAPTVTLIKQADTILLFNIFPHDFSEEIRRKTLLYYEPRTLHYSSLSPGVYSQVAARLGEEKLAMKHFHTALVMDLEDVKKESARALHTPTSGEVYTNLVFGFAGLNPDGDVLELDPHLPKGWQSIQFKFLWKGCNLEFEVGRKQAKVKSAGQRALKLSVRGKEQELQPGKTYELAL